jgi:hypothetical protein
MKFYIHDKCFDKLIDLPKATQKKVFEFQRKFREDSRTAAIHLEPISTFKDPYLRTARIDVKYRAIIKAPKTGDAYYLLWVDNHDEAMAWAANKIFEWNEHTQSAQLFTAPEQADLTQLSSAPASMPSPKAFFDEYSNEQLFALGVPALLLPLVRAAHDLNGLDQIESYLPPEVYEHLFYLSDGASYDTLLAEIEAGKVASAELEEQLASSNNRRSVLEIDEDLIREMLEGEPSKWQLFLHPSQRKLVESEFNGPVKVTGGGGTGKTVVAIHRLKKLSSALPTSSAPILFTTYTHALTNNLRELVTRVGVAADTFELNNVDAIARQLGEQTGVITSEHRLLDMPGSRPAAELWEEALDLVPSEFDAVFMEQEYREVILNHGVREVSQYLHQSRLGRGKSITRKQRLDVWRVVEEYQRLKQSSSYLDRAELFNLLAHHYKQQDTKPFAHVIADEIQDFGNSELRFLRSLVAEKPNDLFLVGDPYQKIYSRRIYFSQVGINVRGNRSKRLRLNYRTTEEIKRLAIATVRKFAYDNFDGEAERIDGYVSLLHGPRPTYQTFTDKGDELQYLMQLVQTQLQETGIKPNDVVIGSRLKESLRDIKTALHQLHIPYYDLTAASGDKTGVRLASFHNLKGLEFKVVLLSDVNTRTCPFTPVGLRGLQEPELGEHLNSERALLYVAMTRCIQHLHITGTGTRSALIQL